MTPIILTERFLDAFTIASRLHLRQVRKGTRIPYLSHLMAVSALVLEDGGDEDQAIAALLHDAVEDQGGLETLALIRLKFGERVANIVIGCTDSTTQPKPDWKKRKIAYIDHLNNTNDDVLRVSLADKLHNARALLIDLKADGLSTFTRFNGGLEGTLWYYRELVRTFTTLNIESKMLGEFISVVSEIEFIANDGN